MPPTPPPLAELASAQTLHVSRDGAPPSRPRLSLDGEGEPTCRDEAWEFDGVAREEPQRLGHFVILSHLGAGGMGVVYSAYDEELDRKVAIKLLTRAPSSASLGQSRILREAQAMARLSHPNVAQVYEVGRFGDQLFVAMEFVRGATLRSWQKEQRRGLGELLKMFIQAGRGLAAAHAAELVHRDFKPDNVIVGGDGRARVLDFGLAHSLTAAERETARQTDCYADTADGGGAPSAIRAIERELSHGKGLMGTPAYMAPEQFLGHQVDARADQFAFCVALFEAVYGARPFAADTLAEHLSCITRGAIATPRADRRVPAWLRRALLRGLAAHPRDRWPSMNALLSELTRDRARTRRRLIGAALVVSSLVVGAAGFARSYGDEADACERVADLGGVWDPPRAQAIHDALTRTGAAYAEDAWRQVQAQLDAHATRWSATRVEACASHLRGAQSDTLYDRRVACLDRRREELAAVTNVLAEADATVVENAGRLAFGLVPVATCDDLERLSAAVLTPEEPQLAARVDALRSRLTRVSAERGAGRYRAALAEARAITDEAEALGYRPLVAEARLELGLLEGHLDHFAGADESLSQALWDAEATGHDEVAVTASQQRILLYGDRMAEYARAHAWLPHAQAIADRVADDRTFAQLAFVRGAVLLDEGRLQEARAELTRAVPLVRQSFGDEHPMTARALRSLASTLNSLGEFDEARGHLEAAVAILERSLGPRHPTLAQVLLTLGNLHIGQGRDDEALAAYGRALEISRAALGDDHVSTGAMTLSVGLVHGQRRELEEADQKFTRALEIFEARLGPEHPNVAVALANLGSTKAAQGQLDAALEHLQRGAAILERVNGDDHKDTSAMRAMLGDVLRRKGDLAGAQALYQRAIATLERTLGPDHHELAIPLAGLARCALDDDRPRQALPLARRALALREANHEEGHDLAADQLLLARCLWDGGGDKAEARALAEAARRALEAAGPRFEAERDEVASWLEGHP